jgi:3-mercaptopyruvate sulfurtransferase SseA
MANIVIIDASWICGRFNQANLDVRARYAKGHIPGNNQGVLPEAYRGIETPCSSITKSPAVVEEIPHRQRFRQPAELAALRAERDVSSHVNKITTCDFGVVATVVATALEIAGCAGSRVDAGSLIEHVQAYRPGDRSNV